MRVEPSIFKAYDIRGTYPDQVNADVAFAVGKAFVTLLSQGQPEKKIRIAVGRDMRVSSPELADRLIAGLLESGADVDDLGLVSTPTFYFGVARFGYDAGVQVSASHNPKEWNGFKLVRAGSVPVSNRSGILEIKKIIEDDSFTSLKTAPGELHGKNDTLAAELAEQVPNETQSGRKLKIAIDPANGMGSLDLHALFGRLGHTVVWLNDTPDGTFPAHPADPMIPSNLDQLRKAVVENSCDVGIASDGDGDRYFFLDETGEAIPQEILRGIMSQLELRAHPNATIVYDARPGRITTDMIRDAGGTSVLAPVGHSLIKEKMLEVDAVFGAESSGHYFFKLPYGTFEAPMLLVSEFLEFVSSQDKLLSQIVAPYKRYVNSGEINTHLASREKGQTILDTISRSYADGRQSSIDGLSVEYPEYWFSVRLSNTEPLVRLIVEAKDEETMARERDRLLATIRQS